MIPNETKIQYQAVKCILEHFDVMKRFDLVSQVPAFQNVDKSVPIRMNRFEIHDSEFAMRINDIDLEMEKIKERSYKISASNGNTYPNIFPDTPFSSRADGMEFLKSLFLEGRHLKLREAMLKICFPQERFQFTMEIDRLTTDSQCAQNVQSYLTIPVKRLELLLIDKEGLDMDLVKQTKILVISEWRLKDFEALPTLHNPVIVFQEPNGSATRLATYAMEWSGELVKKQRTSGQMFMRTRGRRHAEEIVDKMKARLFGKFVDVEMRGRRHIPITKVLCIPQIDDYQLVIHGLEQTLYKFDEPFLCQYVRMEIMSLNANLPERLDRIFNYFTV